MNANSAEQAFNALRAEIAGSRAEQRDTAAAHADAYDLTLGHIAKQLAELTARIAAIEGKPALAFTPDSFGSDLGSIVQAHTGLSAERVLDAAEAMREQAGELQGIVGSVAVRATWRRRIAGGAALGLVAGIVLCFGAVAAFPAETGAWIAATVIGSGPWEAGQALMRQSEPDTFDRMVRLYNACPHDASTDLCEAAMIIRAMPPATAASGKSR